MKFRTLLLFLLIQHYCSAQSADLYRENLSKRVSLDARGVPLSAVLDQISQAGDFFFAYNGELFRQDSLVTINIRNLPVRDVLDRLFQGMVDYREHADYIILRYAALHLTIVPDYIRTTEKVYLIGGQIRDIQTGKGISQATIYEKRLLQSTLTDENGYFMMRFKGKHEEIILTASKERYRDTALIFLSNIDIKPQSYDDPDKEKGSMFSNAIEKLGVGRFFISSKQRIQNLNIPNFLANTPFQTSFTPGLSSHGMMSSSVINKFSLNVLGGYTAGINGLEMAGLFNLTKGDVDKVQVAGLFNTVGGRVRGLQLAGLINEVNTDVNGLQAAGILNIAGRNSRGIQVAGISNATLQRLDGFQIAGIINMDKTTHGAQVAGIGNISTDCMNGVQIAGIFNYARQVKGFQMALVNVADSSSGVNLGLLNLVRHGYHKISLYSNEVINTNISIKTGNAKLYSILFVGKHWSSDARAETFGLGFGHDFIFNNSFTIGAETTAQYLYLGNWNDTNILQRFHANIQVKVGKGLTLFGGPAYAYYNSNAAEGSNGKNYKQQVGPGKHQSFSGNNKGWLGWSAGITLM
ncbi:hypothetical protein PBAL39_01262 [Pedobacter sp. BAL39]|uniref:STN and carboxypeptidase regulatory-like domain-containing protein n=1 Tax=Pedobacter sp. BAL39 TaxID=391596 RepID=UPI0001559395|nr:STN and carboxypeptidase regulatory-like domain-containing protein [Pedobacter sp. BAL39]EDM38201.1 hypothetical protein PBAL39_01262 [Pedobacter sp. BAL39]